MGAGIAAPLRRLAGALAVALALVGATAEGAAAQAFASPDRPGPALSVPDAELRQSLSCAADLAAADRQPVLLIPGTTLTPRENFDWNYWRAFDRLGVPYCSVELPNNAMGDIQIAAEHVVHAIRSMRAASGRRVQVVGYSQGGMIGRWALRFWPDTRAAVDDLVGLAPSNHGTLDADVICAPGCAPAIHQQRPRSQFITALNSFQETFGGVSYTVAYTRTDQVVTPNFDETGSSSLRTGDGARSNIALQEVCPVNVADHLAIGSYDPVGYAIAIDAITHPGPASLAQIDRAVCAQPFMPGVDPARFATDYAGYAGYVSYVARVLATTPTVPNEPALRCYVTASCPAGAPDGGGAVPPSRCLSPRARIGRAGIGRVLLRRSRAQALRRSVAAPRERTRRSLRWCVGSAPGRMTGVFADAGSRSPARLVITTSRTRLHRHRGLRPGGRAGRALGRAFPRRLAVVRTRRGRLVVYRAAARRSRRVIAVGEGGVRFLGVADRSVLRRGHRHRLARLVQLAMR